MLLRSFFSKPVRNIHRSSRFVAIRVLVLPRFPLPGRAIRFCRRRLPNPHQSNHVPFHQQHSAKSGRQVQFFASTGKKRAFLRDISCCRLLYEQAIIPSISHVKDKIKFSMPVASLSLSASAPSPPYPQPFSTFPYTAHSAPNPCLLRGRRRNPPCARRTVASCAWSANPG